MLGRIAGREELFQPVDPTLGGRGIPIGKFIPVFSAFRPD